MFERVHATRTARTKETLWPRRPPSSDSYDPIRTTLRLEDSHPEQIYSPLTTCPITTHPTATLPGLKMTGLVKVTHEGTGGGSSTTEWVHPSVAELFRRKGSAIFRRGGLAAADAEAALEAAVRHKAAMTQKIVVFDAASSTPGGSGKGGRGSKGQQGGQGLDVMSTLRVLETQVLALVEGSGGVSGGA